MRSRRLLLFGQGAEGGSAGGSIPLVKQAPLVFPTCSTCPSPDSYDKTLPGPLPRTRDFLRMDGWGVEIRNEDGLSYLPFVAGLSGSGGSSEHPERLLTGLDYKYDRKLWPRMLREHAERGYTHWLRWWPNARVDGGNSIEQFIDDCKRIQEVIPYVVVNLGSKVFDPRDQTAEEWKAYLGPVLDKLLKANAAEEYIPAFEIDSFNVPGQPTIEFMKWVGREVHAAGKTCWAHFFPEHTSWFKDGEPRGRYGFWDDLGDDVDGLNYQGVPIDPTQPFDVKTNWDIGELQARLVDTLHQFAQQGNRHKLRAMELTAENQFFRDHPTEVEAAAIGYLSICTRHPGAFVWGAGNGLRLPDGSAAYTD